MCRLDPTNAAFIVNGNLADQFLAGPMFARILEPIATLKRGGQRVASPGARLDGADIDAPARTRVTRAIGWKLIHPAGHARIHCHGQRALAPDDSTIVDLFGAVFFLDGRIRVTAFRAIADTVVASPSVVRVAGISAPESGLATANGDRRESVLAPLECFGVGGDGSV